MEYTLNSNLAILSGNGDLPVLLAKSASILGYKTYGIALTNEAEVNLKEHCYKVKKIHPGQVLQILNYLKSESIDSVVFIGKLEKMDLLRNIYKLDPLALKYIKKLSNLNDNSIHQTVDNLLKEHNLKILPQTKFLKHLYQKKEILTKRKPTNEEMMDIEFGMDIAKKIATLDIGQTVVVKNKIIISIEGIDGTNETIKRACKLSKSEVVVCKAARFNQDERFDIPTIGIKTIETIGKNGGGILAFEANKVLFPDKEKAIEIANKYNICLLAV